MKEAEIASSKRRIIVLAALGILLTGALVALSAILPLYLSARESIQQLNGVSAIAQASALENQMARFEDVARQFTSRTEIRRRLEAYSEGRMSFEELVAYTRPRLEEPASKLDDLAAMVRLGPAGEEVVRVGFLATQLPDPVPVPNGLEPLTLRLTDGDELPLMGVAAAILDDQGRSIGQDVLFFRLDSLAALLSEFRRFGDNACLCMVRPEKGLLIAHDPAAERVALGTVDFEPAPATSEMVRVVQDVMDGRPVVRFEVPMGFDDWHFMLRIPVSTLYLPAYRDLTWAFLSVLLLMVLGAWGTRRLMTPLIDQVFWQAEQIQRSAHELRVAMSVVENAQEAIVTTDEAFCIERVNPAFVKMLGFSLEDMKTRSLFDICEWDGRSADPLAPIRARIDEQDGWEGEVQYRSRDGRLIPTLQSISAVRDGHGNIIRLIHIFNDISERKAAERRIKRLASYDTLTGIRNRGAVLRKLEKSIRKAGRDDGQLAVLFIDLDEFKPVNDALGHEAGDKLLQSVAQRIAHSVRESDVVGRLGGDEFLVILDQLGGEAQAVTVATKIIDNLAKPFQINGDTVKIGASIGVALHPAHGDSADELVRKADAVMYRAKEGGRNRVCVSQ